MTDEEALKEIDQQEKRFAAAGCGRGLRLAKSARECYETMVELHQEAVDAEAGCLAAKRKVAWLVRGGGTESLGTITTIRHNMGPCCWPTGMVITIRYGVVRRLLVYCKMTLVTF